ncbi:hypothetical protein KQJ25_16550, partial [Escherichia sp. S69_ASV_4]|nr:hypothetical protein [Escherichia sp. S69_ASV_4]
LSSAASDVYKRQDSVPLLGDIPWFVQLFRHDGKEDERRELVVFITPRLVSSE